MTPTSLSSPLAAEPPEMVLVPREPTQAMIDVGNAASYAAPTHRPALLIYQRMLAALPPAAPQPPEPVAYRWRICNEGHWSEWRHQSHKPQGAVNACFQFEPLYASAAPQPDLHAPELSMSMFATSADYHAARHAAAEIAAAHTNPNSDSVLSGGRASSEGLPPAPSATQQPVAWRVHWIDASGGYGRPTIVDSESQAESDAGFLGEKWAGTDALYVGPRKAAANTAPPEFDEWRKEAERLTDTLINVTHDYANGHATASEGEDAREALGNHLAAHPAAPKDAPQEVRMLDCREVRTLMNACVGQSPRSLPEMIQAKFCEVNAGKTIPATRPEPK